MQIRSQTGVWSKNSQSDLFYQVTHCMSDSFVSQRSQLTLAWDRYYRIEVMIRTNALQLYVSVIRLMRGYFKAPTSDPLHYALYQISVAMIGGM